MSALPRRHTSAPAGPAWHAAGDQPPGGTLDLQVLPVEHVHHFVRLLVAKAHQSNPAQAHRSPLNDVVHRPAGPIRLHVVAQERSRYSPSRRQSLAHNTSTGKRLKDRVVSHSQATKDDG